MARKRKSASVPVEASTQKGLTPINTGLYARLSVLDNGKADGDPIESQVKIIKQYLSDHPELRLADQYLDNGYSGVSFERPQWERLMRDVKVGKINCIIVKDLSRLGRNYIETGNFLERICPKLGIRFISVNDNYDTYNIRSQDELTVSVKNIVNDYYAKDISMKSGAALKAKRQNGEYIGSYAPHGYRKDPENKNRLLVDPETAPVIRKIYDMALDGWGCMRIAKQLMEDKIPITRVKSNTECDVNYYSWGSARISHILRNPFYKGAHLVCRTHQKGIRSNTYDIIPREDWEVIEGCHEAIVTPEEWEQVQDIIDRRPTIMKGNACPFYNLFHGLVYCATCGKSRHTISARPTTGWARTPVPATRLRQGICTIWC